jgi:polyhydroxyalkanoate synthase
MPTTQKTLTTAARNAWALTLGDGVDQPRRTPSEVLFDEEHRVLRRFTRPDGDAGEPVLLVPPLAAPATCFDLRPGCSLAEFLIESGRSPYLVDYGTITFGDRHMGFEDWIDDILPTAIERASRDAGGEPIDLVAWCLGGILSLLTVAAHPDLPVRSVAAIATPIDYGRIPNLAPFQTVARYTGGRVISSLNRFMGGWPEPLVRTSFRLSGLQRELTKPAFIARNLHRTNTLAHLEAVDRYMSRMEAYPGRLYGQMYGRLMLANDLAAGRFELGERVIELDEVRVPVLAVAGRADVIAPVTAAQRILDVLPNAADVRFEVAPGGHLGVLTGQSAPQTTWAHVEKFLSEQAQPALTAAAGR